MISKNQNLMIYIHIPFCIRKCNYCDFLSAPAERKIQQDYVKALTNEMRKEAAFYQDRQVDTVFFGGGTPSILEPFLLEDIIKNLRESFSFQDNPEISMEVNPGTVSFEKLSLYRKLGINRLSIGLQSMNDEELRMLGRIHTAKDFLETYEQTRRAGFDNINVDVMSALPRQTLENYLHTLKSVVSLQPEHISAYSLIIEKGTPFYDRYCECSKTGQNQEALEKQEELPDEELERKMYYETCEFLEGKGYLHYEISNFAKSGKSCRHNIGYWKRRDYLGIGLGAASLINESRWNNDSVLDSYLACWKEDTDTKEKEDFGHVFCQNLSVQEQMEEFMFLGLRMMEGISKEEFFKGFGKNIDDIYGEQLKKLTTQHLLTIETRKEETRIFLTKYGIDISNYVFSEFLL